MALVPVPDARAPRPGRRRSAGVPAVARLWPAWWALALGACGGTPDITAPTLSAPGFIDGTTVDADAITLTVVARDDRRVAEVTFATDRGAADTCPVASGDVYACGPVPLVVGDNEVTVRATDTSENAAVLTLSVRRAPPPDALPPTLAVSGVADGAVVTASSIELAATASDDRGVASVAYASDRGAAGACGPAAGDVFPCGPIALEPGANVVTVSARDAAGNTATDVRTVIREAPAPTAGYGIELVFYDQSFAAAHLAAFQTAAARWAEVIVGDLVDVAIDRPANGSCGRGEPAYAGTVDDVVIFVTSFTDAPGGLLGYAGPCLLRGPGTDASLTAVGFMAFDTLDLDALEANGALVATIVHEMGHVLGIGTLWELAPTFDLLDYVPVPASSTCRTASSFAVPPTFVGAGAVAVWDGLGGSGDVPVEDEGGAGTRCGHWDEAVFGTELMTGWLNVGSANVLSGVTVGSLADLGYAVEPLAADAYALPGAGGAAAGVRLDLAAAEVLVRPVGTVDPVSGDVTPIPRHDR